MKWRVHESRLANPSRWRPVCDRDQPYHCRAFGFVGVAGSQATSPPGHSPRPWGPGSLETDHATLDRDPASNSVLHTSSSAPLQKKTPRSRGTRSPGTIYLDTFDELVGGGVQVADGVWKPTEGALARRVYPFHDRTKNGYTANFHENNQMMGPDGHPGLMVLCWETVPEKLNYSGFASMGSSQEILKLEPLTAVQSRKDLEPLRVRSQYRGFLESALDEPFEVNLVCRLKPSVDDAYKFRLDLSVFQVTDQWQTFEYDLSDAGNIWSCRKVATESPANDLSGTAGIPLATIRVHCSLAVSIPVSIYGKGVTPKTTRTIASIDCPEIALRVPTSRGRSKNSVNYFASLEYST
jgi:hypothetical protein